MPIAQHRDPTMNIAAYIIEWAWRNPEAPPVTEGKPTSVVMARKGWPAASEEQFRAAVGVAAPILRALGENQLAEADALGRLHEAVTSPCDPTRRRGEVVADHVADRWRDGCGGGDD